MKSLKEWNRDLLYEDTFCLYRSHWEETDHTQVFVQDSAASIMNAPCYLSRGKGSLGMNSRMDQPQKTAAERNMEERVLVLFCDLKYDIAIGDLLRVTHQGEVYEVIAGAPHKYSLFQELLVYRRDDA